jgi:O-antigen ligase
VAHTDRLTAPPPPLAARLLDRLAWSDALPSALLAFVAAAFLLPTGAAYAWPFYLLVLPAILLRLQPRPILIGIRTPGAALALALIVWSGLTLAWGHDDGNRTLRFAIEVIWTLAFVAALLAALPATEVRRRLGTVMIWCGAANALLSVVLAQIFPQVGERLHGWGVTTHPILGAIVMTAAYFCALSRALAEPRRRGAHLAASLAMALFILMTESRGPLISALAGTVFLCLAGPWRLRATGSLIAIVIGWTLLPAAVQQHQEKMMIYRGSSHRFEIWNTTLDQIGRRPLFGHGLAANLHMPGGITFPHDLYLSVVFYSGAVGLLLFAGLCLAVTLVLWRGRGRLRQTASQTGRLTQDWLWMVALWMNALLSGLTDLGQLTKGPGPMWFIFWLPVCLILTSRQAGPERAGAAAAPRLSPREAA